MRINKKTALNAEYKLMLVDDDEGIIDSISAYLERNGYDAFGITSPLEGLEELKRNKYDLLILDYFMPLLKGDEFVAKLREFDKDLYVILLTGHTDLAPPLETIKAFDIQAYCEKSPRLDQLLLLIESGIKSINQIRTINQKADELSDAYSTLKASYLETIGALRLAVEMKDEYTRGHSDRVSRYSVLIGEKFGLDAGEIETLRISGLLHDIGKIGISEEILLKKSRLTEDEFEAIKTHPRKGMVILSAVSAFSKATEYVGCHHERIDGSGYPQGLTGDKIPLGARIISVADAFDAMVSDRNYRPKRTKADALEIIRQERGLQFDAAVADCFLKTAEEDPDSIDEILNT